MFILIKGKHEYMNSITKSLYQLTTAHLAPPLVRLHIASIPIKQPATSSCYLKLTKSINTMASTRNKILLLFDVDGTLTKPMQTVNPDFERFLTEKVKPLATVGIVGGSDHSKISKQMGGDEVLAKYDYVFAENGLVYFKSGKLVSKESMVNFIGEKTSQKFINYCLRYLSGIDLPAKRGTFIEFRTSMLNISPVGRSCSQAERDEFAKYDAEHGIRQKFVEAMKRTFPDSGLQFSIGGQISIDVFPKGWDKTYCLNHVADAKFEEIHFFGDKTMSGGNDHEIFEDPRTIGHKVENPEDTEKQLKELLKLT